MIGATKSASPLDDVRYPILLAGDNGEIILASKFDGEHIHGTVVWALLKSGRMGHYSETWDPFEFHVYAGTVTLKNKL